MITAKQIADWAETGAAHDELPRLVRRLIHATTGVDWISMPAGDSTSLPGFDGELYSEYGNPWTPKGFSCWELSCRDDVARKANEDYKKRCDSHDREFTSSRTYVCVSARRWSGKSRWVKDRCSEGIWADVRAYDADDLEQWLEQAPGVETEFSEELGLLGCGVSSLRKFFESWSSQSNPNISASALLLGRKRHSAYFLKCISDTIDEGGILSVRGDSVDEVVAFLSAEVLQDHNLANRSVIVTNVSGWRVTEKNSQIRLAIPIRPELAEVPPRRKGLVVVVPYASGDMAKGSGGEVDFKLDRAEHGEFEKALQGIGVDQNDSRRIATLCGRSWSVFRRQHASNPAISRPLWLDHPASSVLATLCLVGTWSADKEADKEAVARIAGRSYDELERDLSVLALCEDSPVLSIGSVWRVKSPLELLSFFGDRITNSELERFFDEIFSILNAPDPQLELPKEQRYAASVYGKVRPLSRLMFSACCDTLIKLSVRGEDFPGLSAKAVAARVSILVRNLLNDADAQRWLSLSAVLPALAEASPEEFLLAVERSLDLEDAPVLSLLRETDGATGLGGRCWHAGLLWALEIVGWAPQYLARSSLILARLANEPIAGNWGNNPLASLVGFYLSWFPQTGATIAQRIAALDKLIARMPDVAIRLLDKLTDTGHGTANHTARPKWRGYDAGGGRGITHAERYAMLVAAADRQFQLAEGKAKQIAALVKKYSDFDDDRRNVVIRLARNVKNDAEIEAVLVEIRRVLHWHKNYDKGDRKLVDALVGPLDLLYEYLQPCDVVLQNAWLFQDGWIDLPVRYRNEGGSRYDELGVARAKAVAAIFAQEGWAGLLRLSEAAGKGWYVGSAIADAEEAFEGAIVWVAEKAGDLERGSILTEFSAGVLSALVRRNGVEVLRDILETSECCERDLEWKVRLLLLAPWNHVVWNIVSELGCSAKDTYWKECVCNIFYLGDEDDLSAALRELLAYNRPISAMYACNCCFEKIDTELLLDILHDAFHFGEEGARFESSRDVEEAFKSIEARVLDSKRLIELEFIAVPMLTDGGAFTAKSMYKAVVSDFREFVDLVECVYKIRSENEEENLKNEFFATRAWLILKHCIQQPGSLADGTISSDALASFIYGARRLAEERGCLEACDMYLGEIVARGPMGNDNIFPSEPVRDVLEATNSEGIFRGFRMGCINKRGVTWRGHLDGGEQERVLAAQYREYAFFLNITHPHLSSALDGIARSYENDGKREDVEAQLRRESC